jgi:hypothetical protein
MVLVLSWSLSAAANSVNFPPSDFDILDAGSGQLIGHGHYALDESAGGLKLRGENRYFNGEYDIEEDQLTRVTADARPRLLTFRHDFFDAHGTPTVVGRLDIETGLGTCGLAEGGKLDLKVQEFKFPEDTYAGASVLLPIQHLMSGGTRDVLSLHVFNCAPTPKLIAVDVTPQSGELPWADYPGELEKVEVKANFGFWTVVIQPFIPKLAAWFDPSQRMLLVGAQLQRYYKGEKILLVRKREAQLLREPEAELRRDPSPDKAPRDGAGPTSSGH